MTYIFELGNHTEQAHDYTSELIDEAYRRKTEGHTTAHERVNNVDKLCEAYYAQIGQWPVESVLTRLAWYIVFDEMTDGNPDKMSREEYPIMSRGQFRRRDEKTTLLEELPYGDTRELGKRKVTSSMLTDDGENKDEFRPFIDSIRLIGQRRTEADGVVDELSFDMMVDSAGLTEQERAVIEGTFLDDLTQSALASKMGVSQARISHLYNKAIDKIRRSLLG